MERWGVWAALYSQINKPTKVFGADLTNTTNLPQNMMSWHHGTKIFLHFISQKLPHFAKS